MASPAGWTNRAQSRYTDIKEEPIGKMLTSIDGYQNEVLLPLEEAVSPIAHLFIDLEQNVWVAKFNCKNPQDNLTQEESAALHLYTMDFASGNNLYVVLNKMLRDKQRAHLVPLFRYLKLFMTALFKLDSLSAKIWRGVSGEDLSQQYPTGRKFAWWGINSCMKTSEELQASNFFCNMGLRTLFSIECMNGKSIKNHSYFGDMENEVVLMPGTFLEVVKHDNAAEGLHIIHLREIQPPFPLIKPPFSSTEQSQGGEYTVCE
jgi:hypothetical protein